jgi:hypothetical protein
MPAIDSRPEGVPASELGLKVLSEIGGITSTMEPEIDAPVVGRSGNRHHLTFDTYEEGTLTLEEYLGRVVFPPKATVHRGTGFVRIA